MSLIVGLAFGLFYTALAFPIGRMVDRGVRKTVAAAGIGVWSIATVAGGFASNAVQLFFARVFVGAGEASLNPAAYSMLADTFPKERLSGAMGIYTMTAFLGGAAAFIGGGLLLRALTAAAPFSGPLAGFEPWQLLMIIVGLPGLLVAVLVLAMAEPRRRGASEAMPSVAETFAFLSDPVRRSAFVFIIAAYSVHVFASHAGNSWTGSFFIRTFGWEPAQFGLFYGLSFLIFGAGGAFAGGWYGDRLRRKGHLDAQPRAAAIAMLIAWPINAASTLMGDAGLALALTAASMFFSTFVYPLAASALQVLTPNRMRGQISAIYLTVINVAGLFLGPLAVALMTDFGFGAGDGVRYSLAVVNAITPPAMALLLFLALPHFRRAAAEQPA
jgi:MFS family permease